MADTGKNKNIIGYLQRQTASFRDVPMNDVDSLILCTIGYCYLEEGVMGTAAPTERVPLPMALCGIPHERLFGESWLIEFDGKGFLSALLASPRFAPVKLAYYTNEISPQIDKQFSAVTFMLPDGSTYIAYRGTDNTLAGWKEDFNLCFMDVVPSQVSAKHYLAGVASATNGPLIVGGHSKGGNIAEFAALTASDQVYERLTACYNHDGPSFMNDPSPRIDEPGFIAKLHKTVPESSVFGMLMERRGNYRVIRARNMAFFQHAPLNWVVEGDDFVNVKTLSDDASLFDETMNTWMAGYTPQKRAEFVDTVFEVIKSTNASTWAEFDANHAANMATVLGQMTKVDPEIRDMALTMFGHIAQFYSSETFRQAREFAPLELPTKLTMPKLQLPKIEMPQLPFMKPQEKSDDR